MSRPWFAVLVLSLLALSASAFAESETLRFRVYLDQSPIGEHSFQLVRQGPEKRVVSRASFDVKLLVFNAYRYRHDSVEQWRDGCLERIEATTDDNGEDIRVEGQRVADSLTLAVNGRPSQLPACVSTFAYWAPDLLKRSHLLNPQNGELIEVRLEPQGKERRKVRGAEVEAQRYRLRAGELDINLWYTADGDWIGLESDTGKGRLLRYQRL